MRRAGRRLVDQSQWRTLDGQSFVPRRSGVLDQEPYTPEEQAYKDAVNRGDLKFPSPEGYDESWLLMDNEVWPWTETEEAEYWKGFGEVERIGFYGGAPHRPKG